MAGDVGPLPELAPYLGRWVAVVRGRVVGVGRDAAEARHMAKRNRPKESPQVLFVSPQLQVTRALDRYPLVERAFDLAARLRMKVYLVGGSVRDMLLGAETHDLDFAVDGDGLTLARYVAGELGGAFVTLDVRRQTGRVVLGRPPDRQVLDFASLRGRDLLSDLRGRDFTINAIAVGRRKDGGWQLYDPLGGCTDLMARRLRVTSATSFADDPLRTLRAVRMRAQFGCLLDVQSEAWLRAAVPSLREVSAERIRDEWFKLLDLPGAADSLRELCRLGLWDAIVSSERSDVAAISLSEHSFAIVASVERLLDALAGRERVGEGLESVQDVAPQLCSRYASFACDERTYRALLKCAALLCSVGQGDPDLVAAMLGRRWRLSNGEVNMLRTVVTTWSCVADMARQGLPGPREIHRYFRQAGEYGVDAAFITLADCALSCSCETEGWRSMVETVGLLWQAYYRRRSQVVSPPPLLSGHDLIAALGLSPGPLIGELLTRLREEQAAGQVRTRQEALACARRMVAELGGDMRPG